MKKFLTTAVVVLGVASIAQAGPCHKIPKVETYAHPTLFRSQAQALVDADSVYVTGAKAIKPNFALKVNKKENVLIAGKAKDILNKVSKKHEAAGLGKMAVNAPTMRSEVAAILAEGLDVITPENYSPYSDIANEYWAKDYIYRVTEKGIMIGYPSGVFKPDQPITKAEVFATVAQLINVEHSQGTPIYAGSEVKFIPTWAEDCTNEVIASGLLKALPDQDGIVNNEFLTKEQVAYLVSSLKANWDTLTENSGFADACPASLGSVKVKMLDRISAKHSNIGDAFQAKTTESATIDGVAFPAGSIVKGKVVAVNRPGIKNPGFVKVKFLTIQNGDCVKELPKRVQGVDADITKNPNILARILGLPFSAAGRVVGVVGRSGGAIVDVAGNGLEQLGDNLSNTFVETFCLHPGRGTASFGQGIVTIFKGVFDITKVVVSGTFGVVYELCDDIVYCIVPSCSNNSSLNPDEELTIIF